MPHPICRPAAFAALVLAAATASPAAARNLDLRAASQRACLEVAEHQGFHVLHLARPVPIMGARARVRGETVRMEVGHQGASIPLRCVYDIREMRAELYNR